MIERYVECVECKACVQICPKSCISFSNDGKIELEREKCIGCKLCERVCQVINNVKYNKSGDVYAAIGTNSQILNHSSSGGLARIFYEYILDKGGVVFGVKYINNLEPVIDYVESKEDLSAFLKSKYCFSNVGESYKRCREFCVKGRMVLFIALPCQIAGLHLFLNRDYDNLITIDILCHGAPQYIVFKNHIMYLEKKAKHKIVDYQFRDKDTDYYGPYHYKITYDNGKVQVGSALWDAYYNAFLKSDIFRESCYKCAFSCRERVADITLGDFWKAGDIIPALKKEKYISSLIVNTGKGAKLLYACKDNIFLYKSNFRELERSTHAVKNPAKRTTAVDVNELKDNIKYYKWASKYERSIRVFASKIKNIILRRNT